MKAKWFEKGQGFIEYAFILILIAIVLIITLELVGIELTNFFFNIQATLEAL